MVKIECDLLDSKFIIVSPKIVKQLPIDLLLLPIFKYLCIYSSEVTAIFRTSLIKTPFSGDYLNSSFALGL